MFEHDSEDDEVSLDAPEKLDASGVAREVDEDQPTKVDPFQV